MQNKLKKKLEDHIVIFDGAIGTEFYKKGFFVNISYEGLCLSAPDTVKEIHKAYFDAGAEVMTTNSYGANRNKLSRFGLADQVSAINAAAVKLAREAADEETLIAASIGPVGETGLSGRELEEKAIDILSEQLIALQEAGADFILFETFSSRQDVEFAYKACCRCCTIPFMFSFSTDRNLETAKGEPLALVLQLFEEGELKPDAIGLNCGEGAEGMLSSLEKLTKITTLPVVARPNAGVPKNVENRMIYMSSPEYLMTYAMRYVTLGVRGVGGCCGTGPEHIAEMARSISPLSKSMDSRKLEIIGQSEPELDPVPAVEKSRFARKLTSGEWVNTIEITPPRGFDLSQTIEKARQSKEAGIDAINIPDGPRASSRISPIITAIAIQEQAGIEAILHCCCRDKNLIGMQADLLGCTWSGVNNILFITGDPPKLGDYPFASAVFDVDSIGMLKVASRLNRGIDIGGKSTGAPTRIFGGAGADPNAIDMEREYRRLREKVEAGAEFIITQPVFAIEPLLRFVENISDLQVPVIAGIWPLASYRNAEFMRNEVPGVVVPDSIMERMGKFEQREEQREEGIAIARESIAAIRKAVQGVQVSAPFGNVTTAIKVIRD